jgi:hypothetical protein
MRLPSALFKCDGRESFCYCLYASHLVKVKFLFVFKEYDFVFFSVIEVFCLEVTMGFFVVEVE